MYSLERRELAKEGGSSAQSLLERVANEAKQIYSKAVLASGTSPGNFKAISALILMLLVKTFTGSLRRRHAKKQD